MRRVPQGNESYGQLLEGKGNLFKHPNYMGEKQAKANVQQNSILQKGKSRREFLHEMSTTTKE